MSSCVYYKFKSRKEIKKICFDGPSISVKDLRERILLQTTYTANDMILKIEKHRDSSTPKDAKLEEYKDDEFVKKFSTVIVSRVPCQKKEVSRPKIANPEVMSRKDPYKAMTKDGSKDMKFHEVQKNSKLYELDLSEEDKINLMMKQSTEGYFLDKNPRNRGQPPGPPPLTYVCYRCKMSGHYVNQCPGIKDKEGNPVDLKNLKRPTGIPQDFLVEVSKDTPGAYLTKDGRYTLPKKDRDAFAKGKKEKRPFSEEENPVYVPTERKPVDMIVCPLCQDVMREAVFISCCGYTYCQECLTDYIFNTDVKGCGRCPNCNSSVESSESFTENPTVRELVRKYNAGVINLFTNTTKSAFQVKGESGTDVAATATTSVTASTSTAVKASLSAKPEKEIPATTTTTTSVGSATATSLPASQSPPIEDESNAKPKETGAIRGPFVDGRRVLKPKPPPEVTLTRRSDTLKTEANPTVPASGGEKLKTETAANDFELDLGLDDTTDSFLSENIKQETLATEAETATTSASTTEIPAIITTTTTTITSTATPPETSTITTAADSIEVKQETPEQPSPVREESKIDAEDGGASPLSADKESVGGETISVHTFETRFNRHERNASSRNMPSKREPLSKTELHKSSKGKPMNMDSAPSGSNAMSTAPLPIASSVPSTHGSMLRAPGMVIPSIPHFRSVATAGQVPAQNLHPRSHVQPTVMVGPQFQQSHYYQMYNSAFYDVAQTQGTLGAGAIINGVVPGPIPIPNPDIIDAPILSEDQFNILRRNFLQDEANYDTGTGHLRGIYKRRHHHRRRRHRSRSYSRSRSRDRYSLSRSPPSRRRRGGSRDRECRSRSSRRWAAAYPEGRQRRSPHSHRNDSPSMSRRKDIASMSRRKDSPHLSRRQESPHLPRRQESPHLPRQQDSPHLSRRQDSPHLSRRQESPHLSRRQESPHLPRRQDSPHLSRRQDSPQLSRRKDSPLSRRQDSSHLPHRQESPQLSRRQESPHLPRRNDSPSMSRRQESPHLSRRQDSPHLFRRQESPHLSRRNESPSMSRRQESPHLSRRKDSPVSRRQDSPHLSRRPDSPPFRRYDSPSRPRSYHSRSRHNSGSWRASCSPVPYGASASSSHKVSPYRTDKRPRERSRSLSGHRKYDRSEPEARRSPEERFEVDSRSHRSHRNPDLREAYVEDWRDRRSPTARAVEKARTQKPPKVRSCQSSESSHSTAPEAVPKKRKRRPSLDGLDAGAYPTLKQSRSQGSLQAYKAESMQLLKREHRVRDDRVSSRQTYRHIDEDSRHSARSNASRGEVRSDREKRAASPDKTAWYSKTSSFLEKLGVAKPKPEVEAVEPKVRSKPKRTERKPSESGESAHCVPLMDIVVEYPDVKAQPESEVGRKVAKAKKVKKKVRPVEKESPKTKASRRASENDVEPEPVVEPARKKDRTASSDDQTLASQESKPSKKKSKKEKKEKKEKKKKKKKRREEKEEAVIEAPTEVEILPPVEAETELERQTSALIPPPSKWELELDEHMNEFEEESRQESARSSTRIPSLVSSVNYRRVSLEEDVEVPKKPHKSKKEGKRHKKKKHRERH